MPASTRLAVAATIDISQTSGASSGAASGLRALLEAAVLGSGAAMAIDGDRVNVVFPDPRVAFASVGQLLALYDGRSIEEVPRIGLHLDNDPADLDPSFVADRLAADATPGQVLATGPLAEEAREVGLLVSDGKQAGTFEVRLVNPYAAASTDPTCGLLVEHQKAAGMLRTEQGEAWFCSQACVLDHIQTSG